MTRPLYPHPLGWNVATLEPNSEDGVVLKAASGSTPPTDEEQFWGGTYPWLTPKEVTDLSTNRRVGLTERTLTLEGLAKAGGLCPANTVLLTKRAPVGIPVVSAVPLATNQGFLSFTCGARLNPEFLYYWLRSNRAYLDAVANGSTYPELYVGDLFELEIAFPDLEDQDRIVSVLRTLDDKIELNRRMNATLEAMARALFQSWFVDFDPVRATLDGHKSPGLDPATAALFPKHFDTEDGGVLPHGWSRKVWGDIATLEYGKSLRDYREHGGKYRVFGTNGPIGFHDKALCGSAGIVIGRKGAYRGVHYSPDPFFVIDTAFYLKPIAPLDLKWAYYELLRLDINSMDSGSAIPSTSRDEFYGVPVVFPRTEIQDAFGKIVGGWFAKIFANDQESRNLATLRDTLLPKLLGGELRIAA